MKALLAIIALTFVVSAHADDKTCPVSGKPVKEGVTTKHDGKDVGFCCNNCKAKFEADPAKFSKK